MDVSHLSVTFGEMLSILVFIVGLLTHYFTTSNRISTIETRFTDFKEYTDEIFRKWETDVKKDIDILFDLVRKCNKYEKE